MGESLVINKEKLLLVEGKDDRAAIYHIVKSLGIDNIQVAYLKGKDNVNDFIDTLSAALKTPQTNNIKIKTFGVMLDADDNEANSSFQKVCSFLKELQKRKIKDLNFDIPKNCAEFTNSETKVGVYVMPDCLSKGMLETLCMKSVENDSFYDCVEDFIGKAVEIKNDLDHIDKRKVLSFIALKAKKGQRKTVGEAVEEDIFDINSSAFDKVKKFLTDMSEL